MNLRYKKLNSSKISRCYCVNNFSYCFYIKNLPCGWVKTSIFALYFFQWNRILKQIKNFPSGIKIQKRENEIII